MNLIIIRGDRYTAMNLALQAVKKQKKQLHEKVKLIPVTDQPLSPDQRLLVKRLRNLQKLHQYLMGEIFKYVDRIPNHVVIPEGLL